MELDPKLLAQEALGSQADFAEVMKQYTIGRVADYLRGCAEMICAHGHVTEDELHQRGMEIMDKSPVHFVINSWEDIIRQITHGRPGMDKELMLERDLYPHVYGKEGRYIEITKKKMDTVRFSAEQFTQASKNKALLVENLLGRIQHQAIIQIAYSDRSFGHFIDRSRWLDQYKEVFQNARDELQKTLKEL